MATIPKYVYEDLKQKAYNKLAELENEIISPYQKKIEEENKKTEEEFTKKIIKNVSKYNYRLNSGWHDTNLVIDIPKKEYQDMQQKQKDLNDKLQKLRRKIHEELDSQIDEWLIGIYTKASDGQPIKLPEFKIDKTKFKL